MYSQHFRDVLNSGKGDGTFLFIIVMFNNLENQIFQYNGSPITFQKGDSVMINATEMAKPFGKLAKDWLSNKSTKEFLSTLSAVRTIPLTGLVDKVFKIISFLFVGLRNCCTFAVSQFYYHIRIGDFLCPPANNCIRYKQRFLRTYSPQSRYGTVTSWRNSLLSLFINF